MAVNTSGSEEPKTPASDRLLIKVASRLPLNDRHGLGVRHLGLKQLLVDVSNCDIAVQTVSTDRFSATSTNGSKDRKVSPRKKKVITRL